MNSLHPITASLVISGVGLKPIYREMLVDRLMADYAISRLTVLVRPEQMEDFAIPVGKYPGIFIVKIASSQIEVSDDVLFLFTQGNFTSDQCIPFEPVPWTGEQLQLTVKGRPAIIEIDPFGRSIDKSEKDEERGLSVHSSIFQKYSTVDDPWEGNFIYFPYFPVWRNPSEVGSQRFARHHESSLGFRLERDKTLTNREKDQYLVLLYGGSAAYGKYNSEAHSVAGWLERIANERLQILGHSPNVSVLNLAQPSSTVTEAAVIHALIGQGLRPDHVILHYGWNDIPSVEWTDPVLIKEGITHASPAFSFLEHYHSTRTGKSLEGPGLKYLISNPIGPMFQTIIDRTKLFSDLVTALGGKLTIGIQPCVFQRLRPHPDEAKVVLNVVLKPKNWAQSRHNIVAGLAALSEKLPVALPNIDVIDFEPVFRDVEADRLLFWDRMHPTSHGCRLAAEIYAEKIVSNIIATKVTA